MKTPHILMLPPPASTCHARACSCFLVCGSLPPPTWPAAALVAAKAVQWAARRWLEHVSGARLRRKQLQGRMQLAEGYEEWAEAAQEVAGCWL